MGILRRLFTTGEGPGDAATTAATAEELDAAERAYERELLSAEQARLDELQDRQLRFGRYAWRPGPEGGERRADDSDAREAAGPAGDEP